MYWVRTHGNTSDLLIGQVTKRKVFQEFFFLVLGVVLILLVHAASNFVVAINCFTPPLKQRLISFLITFFSLLCGILS